MRKSVMAIFRVKDEVFFVKRQNHLRAFPGYTSFPGGKVDRGEELQAALIRECHEELRYEIKNATKHLGIAASPAFNPLRFEAHYFLIELNEKPDFILDKNEIEYAFWATPDELVKKYQDGELLLIPPMLRIMQRLLSSEDSSEVAEFHSHCPEDKVPSLETVYGVKQVMPLSYTVPPADRTNSFHIGDTLIDPSPKDEAEFIKFKNTLNLKDIHKIMLTHHHGDHHKFAPDLARELGVPLYLSEDTYQRILKYDENYFANIEIHFLKEGDVLTQWLGEDVKIMEVPGHDEGQLAPYPVSKRWFIAGDLFQGIGTVVVGGDEGNMQKYFHTLNKVIQEDFKCVFPSHGIALGGVHILAKTLEHRKMRESQVLEMHQKGMSLDEMLKTIYFDLPEKLIKYAKANIQSHLDKLKTEEKI